MRPKKTGFQPHVGAETHTWLTPRWLLDKLGRFDLDPCGEPGWITADNHYYELGLMKPWYGRVWCNPPYGKETFSWLHKLSEHGDGIALVFARTDTKWFNALKFDAINMIKNRIGFLRPEDIQMVNHYVVSSNGNAPSMLIAWGQHNVDALHNVPGRVFIEHAKDHS